jgi:predicted nucleotide-binding protein (sugar kinase/HSP70/actin superfamily)
VQQIVERSGTLFFSFQELDSTKPAGSVKIRVETIAHYLQKYAKEIIARKKSVAAPACPLVRETAQGPHARDPAGAMAA